VLVHQSPGTTGTPMAWMLRDRRRYSLTSETGAHQQPVLNFKKGSVGPSKPPHARLLRRLRRPSALRDSGVKSTSSATGAVSRADDERLKPYSNCSTTAMVRVGGGADTGGPSTIQGRWHVVVGDTPQAIGYQL